MVKVICFRFQSNIYVSKKRKRKDENKSKKMGGGGAWVPFLLPLKCYSTKPCNFEAKVIIILKYSSDQLTTAKNLIFFE